jgi:adenylyltransferase/sulfurtransferase
MTAPPIEISVSEVKALLDEQAAFLLLDCREDNEHALAHIDGAVQIPMGSLPDRIHEIEAFRELPIVVHCHHGGRSLRVANWLRNKGFANARNMTGGIDAWSQEVDSSVERY